jgi:hypothetical protein
LLYYYLFYPCNGLNFSLNDVNHVNNNFLFWWSIGQDLYFLMKNIPTKKLWDPWIMTNFKNKNLVTYVPKKIHSFINKDILLIWVQEILEHIIKSIYNYILWIQEEDLLNRSKRTNLPILLNCKSTLGHTLNISQMSRMHWLFFCLKEDYSFLTI